MSLSIVIPAYQEAENLAELLPAVKTAAEKIGVPYEVLVIDTIIKMDAAEEVCKANGCTYVNREHGNNYGDAVRTGADKASNEFTVFMDADASHNPKDIIRFYQKIENGYDLIIGSRYIHGGNSHNSIILKLMSYTLNLIYRLLFRIKAKDISNSFRMYRTKQLKSLKLRCDNFDIVEEILIKLSLSIPSFRLLEVPVFFEKRKYGKSKRNLLKFIFSYVKTIKRLFEVKYEKT
ncbi:MAG: glycosyltransferase [Spirochaetaceae bacterium]|jgi:dolichol-phosphate mannosyltransferase|nr:glycosyltransferase [Spirochaetaceae bacterium]